MLNAQDTELFDAVVSLAALLFFLQKRLQPPLQNVEDLTIGVGYFCPGRIVRSGRSTRLPP
jgi:hypothetical protein